MQTYLCNGKYKHFSSDFVTSIIDKRVISRGDFQKEMLISFELLKISLALQSQK